MTRVHISPWIDQVADDNGIGRIIHAQHRMLPALGIDLVHDPAQADVIACHVQQSDLPRVDVLHCHGLYWTGDPGSGVYHRWHHDANARILAAARRARWVTVPSAWVAAPFLRDMRIVPEVIGHGIDLDDWGHGTNQGHVLWNKNRAGDVCDPTPALELARRIDANVITTFAPPDIARPANLRVCGVQPHVLMASLVESAHVYLATTKETFGIGTLEAMAAGVPVLGYRWGGTADLVVHKETGYLVEPGDLDGLAAGYRWLTIHRREAGAAARESAAAYDWLAVMLRYAACYTQLAATAPEENRAAIVITTYNYGRYVAQAIDSALAQTRPADEVVVVDDGSTDDSLAVLDRYRDRVRIIQQPNQGVAAARNAGIAATSAAFICCLDADDTLHPDYLAALVPVLERDRGIGITWSGLAVRDEQGRTHGGRWSGTFSWDWQAQAATPPHTCIPTAALFRRRLWERAGGYQQRHAPGEDAEFYTRGLSVGFTAVKATDQDLIIYRLHANAAHERPYIPIDPWHPWMRDGRYPMAAPAAVPPLVRSYDQPVVSVIIPVGPGHQDYLTHALDSLLAQTCRDWEAIVIDDTGPEGIGVERLIPYPFVRLLETRPADQCDAPPCGVAVARNTGLDAAHAPLVLFLDADDWLRHDALELLLQAHGESDGRYGYSDWLAVHADGTTEVHACPDYDQAAWHTTFLHGVTALVPTVVARQVGGFDPTLAGWEEWDFYAKLAAAGVCGVRVPAPLLCYRVATGQRRQASRAQQTALRAQIANRYKEDVMGCCGGSAPSATTATQAVARLRAYDQLAQHGLPLTTTDGDVRLQFVGSQRGAMSYLGPISGRTYRAGQNAIHRYIDADPRDAAHLLSLGVFAVVPRPAVTPDPDPPIDTEVLHAPDDNTDVVLVAAGGAGRLPDESHAGARGGTIQPPAKAPKRARSR